MDTNVQTVDQNSLVDLFPSLGGSNTDLLSKPTFNMVENQVDILSPSITEQTTLPPETNVEEKEKVEGKVDENSEVDILNKPERQLPAEMKDLSSYFQERVKSGKFIAVEEEDAEGNKVPFIPNHCVM